MTDQGDDYTAGDLLDYPYFNVIVIIAIDLRKQQVLDADLKVMQMKKFTSNLEGAGNTKMVFVLEEATETILNFSNNHVKVL